MYRRRFLRATGIAAASSLAFPAILRAQPVVASREGTTTSATDASTASFGRPASSRRRPNLLVFLPDQQRADTLVPYGDGRCHAPNLNRLASQSTVFDRCYITHPVCTPSRSSLLTGTWPHQNGCTHNNVALAPQWKTLPEMLGDAAKDYRTAYMGKWHLGDEVFAQRGFHDWVSIEDNYQQYFNAGRDRTAISDYSKFLLSRGLKPNEENGTFSRRAATNMPIELCKPRFLETRAVEFMERHRHDPFILFVAFLEPHSPYNGPLNTEHRDDEIEFNATSTRTFGPDIPLRYRLKQEYMEASFGTTVDDYRPTKRNYFGLVTQIDRSIGAILGKLDALGLANDTIVVHTSDHGEMAGDHRLFDKEVMFDPSARVPYLVRLPGQTRQHRVTQPVSHIDFVPTMIDLLGAPVHAQCAGRSRARLARGDSMPAETIFAQWSPNVRDKFKEGTRLATPEAIARGTQESTRTAVSPDGWKLNLRDTGEHELYRLTDDPLEQRNVFGRAENRTITERLRAEIELWQSRAADSLKLA